MRPTQVVVAYSNADWPVQYQPFFDMADEVLPKSADYVTFKQSVDELLQEHFSVGFHLGRLDAELERLGAADWRSRRAVRQAVADGDVSRVQRALKRRNVDEESAQVMIGLVQVAVGVAQIWTN